MAACSRATAGGMRMGKLPYRKKRIALQAKNTFCKNTGRDKDKYDAYKCPECGRWHFGKNGRVKYLKRQQQLERQLRQQQGVVH